MKWSQAVRHYLWWKTVLHVHLSLTSLISAGKATQQFKQSGRFLSSVRATSSHRLPDAPARADVQLYLLLSNRKGLHGDVVTNSCLGCSDQETAPDPERCEEVKHQSTGPVLSESKFLLLQEDGRQQDLMGDSFERQRNSREPSCL